MATATVARRAGFRVSKTPAAPVHHVDLTLAVATLGIALTGLVMVYSATRNKLAEAGSETGWPKIPTLENDTRPEAAIDCMALAQLLARNAATAVDLSLSRPDS